jgi:outer membrane immunogenic protein
MKKLFLASAAVIALAASSASAADLRAKPVYKAPPPPVVAPVYNWSGFYVGAHVGGAWGHTSVSQFSDFLEAGSMNVSGAFGGGQIGFNWMAAPNVLLGIESDVSGTRLSGSTITQPPFVAPERLRYEDRIDVFGTVRGRLGYASNNWLIYGTGGFAWADDTITRTQLAGNPQFAPPVGFVASHEATRTGGVAGGGVEWGFAPNWSAKVEYLYFSLGGQSFIIQDPTHAPGGGCSGGTICVTGGRLTANTLRVGVNYRFDWGKGKGPVVARY